MGVKLSGSKYLPRSAGSGDEKKSGGGGSGDEKTSAKGSVGQGSSGQPGQNSGSPPGTADPTDTLGAILEDTGPTDEELLELEKCTKQTRWVLPPKSKLKIFVKFFSKKVETVGCRLHFEVVSGYWYLHNNQGLVNELKLHCNSIIESNEAILEADEAGLAGGDPSSTQKQLALTSTSVGSPKSTGGSSPAKKKAADAAFVMPNPPVVIARKIVQVCGTAAFPFINSAPLNMFMRRIKLRPVPPLFAARQYIMSRHMYDFGPLLIGKDLVPRDRADHHKKIPQIFTHFSHPIVLHMHDHHVSWINGMRCNKHVGRVTKSGLSPQKVGVCVPRLHTPT